MSLVRYYAAATLDGYIAESDDTLDWLLKYEGEFEGADSDASRAGYEGFYEGIGALVMGSVTYEWVLEHVGRWPYAGKPTWVLSTRELESPEGEGVEVRLVDAKPLFARRLPGGSMQLLGVRTFSSGMIGLTYELRQRGGRS